MESQEELYSRIQDFLDSNLPSAPACEELKKEIENLKHGIQILEAQKNSDLPTAEPAPEDAEEQLAEDADVFEEIL